MRSIRIMKAGKMVKEIPWSVIDESFFRQNEGYMLTQGMTLVISDPRDDIPQNSFIAMVNYLGKVKADRRGGDVRWANMTVKESTIDTISVGMELIVKIPVDRVDRYFPNGLPNQYIVVNPNTPSDKFIHRFGNIIPVADRPTTTVTVISDV